MNFLIQSVQHPWEMPLLFLNIRLGFRKVISVGDQLHFNKGVMGQSLPRCLNF